MGEPSAVIRRSISGCSTAVARQRTGQPAFSLPVPAPNFTFVSFSLSNLLSTPRCWIKSCSAANKGASSFPPRRPYFSVTAVTHFNLIFSLFSNRYSPPSFPSTDGTTCCANLSPSCWQGAREPCIGLRRTSTSDANCIAARWVSHRPDLGQSESERHRLFEARDGDNSPLADLSNARF